MTGHRYKYRGICEDCGKKFKSNWETGANSVTERILRHKIEYHEYEPTKEEKELLERIR